MNENTNYDFEVLLVNDGSKDKTIEIIKEMREKEENILNKLKKEKRTKRAYK